MYMYIDINNIGTYKPESIVLCLRPRGKNVCAVSAIDALIVYKDL